MKIKGNIFFPHAKKNLAFWPIYLKILSSRHTSVLLCVYNFVWVKESDFLLCDKNTIMINVLLIFFFYTRMLNHNIVATDNKKNMTFSFFLSFLPFYVSNIIYFRMFVFNQISVIFVSFWFSLTFGSILSISYVSL